MQKRQTTLDGSNSLFYLVDIILVKTILQRLAENINISTMQIEITPVLYNVCLMVVTVQEFTSG